MAASKDNPLLKIRCVMETPVLEERMWAKVPNYPTDAVLIDMEDTVAQDRKLEGRAAVIKSLEDKSFFGDRVLITRPNSLETEWGHDDTVALARAGAELVLLPMVTCAADVLAYQTILRDNGADPEIMVAFETPGSVGDAEAIVAIDRVTSVTFGEGDLTGAMHVPIFEPDGSLNPILNAARTRVYLAAHNANCAILDIAFLKDLKDLDALRTRLSQLYRMGATGFFALYPPHIPVILEIFKPTQAEVDYSHEVVEAFEKARAEGKPAVQLHGKAVLIHDYHKAQAILETAGAPVSAG